MIRATWRGEGQFPAFGATGNAWPAAGFDDPDSPEQGAYCFEPDIPAEGEEGIAYYCDPDRDLEFIGRGGAA